MKTPVRVILLSACCAAAAVILVGCGGSPPTTLVQAPPGPKDLGPATGLSTPPPGAIVFDLKYRAQTGDAADISYHSYWGFGGSSNEAKTNSFLQDVRKRNSRLYEVYNSTLTGRKWAAVEYVKRQALAFYFDLDADGRLGTNECLAPTRKVDQGVEFITPDFMQPLERGGQVLCRALLQVNFYGRNSTPNCMWSAAALLEGIATLDGQPARLLLFANRPGGTFNEYGSSSYSLFLGDRATNVPAGYLPREMLSTLIPGEGTLSSGSGTGGQFYHLTVEGWRTNGLPARVLLVKDASPTGELAVKLAASNSLQAAFTSLSLHGVEDKTVHLRVAGSGGKIRLPEGAYALDSGDASYGTGNPHDWEVSFRSGPRVTVKAAEVSGVVLGQPTLKVRAIDERNRYSSQTAESTRFQQGTPIYLEPRIVGKGQEVFSRFRQPSGRRGEQTDRPPRITLTSPDGQQLLSQVMEYG